MDSRFTRTEQEIIVLNAVWDAIGDMVNYRMFLKPDREKDIELRFESSTHQRLFNILLVDFLSQPRQWPFDLEHPPRGAPEVDRTFLFQLRRICNEPILNSEGSSIIKSPLDAFSDWLQAECVIEKVWLPSVNTETTIRVSRISFIRICGNIAKHNFARLSDNVRLIREILAANGHAIDEEEGYLVLPEFYEWFHEHVFSYHSSAIAEFLNNLRWGIYQYLKPEFDRSFTRDDPASIAYRFIYPPECSRPVAQTMYWDLMNAVRSPPYMPQFEVTRFLKMRY